MKKFSLLLMMLFAYAGYCAEGLVAGAVEEKGSVPFTPWYRLAEELTIPGGNAPMFSGMIEFPAVPQKEGQAVVLKLNHRLISKMHGGWNRYLGIELNGADVRGRDSEGVNRLLVRGAVLHTTLPNEAEVTYWLDVQHPYLLAFFAPAEVTEVDSRVIDRAEGFNFYLLIDDLVNKLVMGADNRVENDKPNRIRFCNSLLKNIADNPMYIKEATLGYVPVSRLNELRGVKMYPVGKMAQPEAAVKGNGFTLNVTRTGGMELVAGKGHFYFESLFSYAADPLMKYNTFGVAECTGEAGISAEVKADGTAVFRTGSLQIERKIVPHGHFLRVSDCIRNVSREDVGLIWKNLVGYNGKMPKTWRLSGVTASPISTSRGAANPSLYLTDGESAVALLAEDTVSRTLLDIHPEGNFFALGGRGVGIPAGKSLNLDWCIYPLLAPELDYFDFVNRVREDWKVNDTIPGPFHFAFTGHPGLKVQFGFLNPWHRYSNGWKYTDAQYVSMVSSQTKDLRKQFPGIKLLGKVEHNLVPMKVGKFPRANQLPLTRGNRKDPKTRYAQYLPPELSRKLVAETPFRDSMLWNAEGGVMIDNYYTYDNYDTINLMVQVEDGNERFKMFMEQIHIMMDQVGLDGVYIDQFNPGVRDGIDYSKWDGYSVKLDSQGRIKSKFYNFVLTGAEARMKIIRKIIDKGGIAFTNGHPVTREEQSSGRLSFAEMENDYCDPISYFDTMPPESASIAMGHLSSPIILNLRPERYVSEFPADGPDLRAKILNKGLIMALRNGNIPYYYYSEIPLEGPTAGSFEVMNWMQPFTPVKLGEGVMVGKERTIVCRSGSYTVKGGKKPLTAKFDCYGKPVEEALPVSGKPGAWEVKITLDDWNEIAVVKVQD